MPVNDVLYGSSCWLLAAVCVRFDSAAAAGVVPVCTSSATGRVSSRERYIELSHAWTC